MSVKDKVSKIENERKSGKDGMLNPRKMMYIRPLIFPYLKRRKRTDLVAMSPRLDPVWSPVLTWIYYDRSCIRSAKPDADGGRGFCL